MRGFVKRHYPLFLVLPALLTALLLLGYPLFITIRTSFYEWHFGSPWSSASYVGLANYRWMFTGGDYFLASSIKTTLAYVLAVVGISLSIGLGIALLMNKIPRGGSAMMAAFLIPMLIMPAVLGMVWRLYFVFDGFFNYLVETFLGFKVVWYSSDFALSSVILTTCWMVIPFFVLVFYAAVSSLPLEPYESAKIDGASRWLVFKDITLPLLKPIILITGMIQTINVFRRFDLPWILYFGWPGTSTEILPLHLYRVAFIQSFLGRGCCISLLLILIVLIVCTPLARSLIKTWRK